MFKIKGDKTNDLEFSLCTDEGDVILQANGIGILYIDGSDGTLTLRFVSDKDQESLPGLQFYGNEIKRYE